MTADVDATQVNRSNQGFSETDELRISDLIDTILQYWYLAVLVTGLVVVSGVAFAISQPSIYQADAVVQIEDKKNAGIGGLKDVAAAFDMGQSPTLGEIEIIKSRDLLFKAIRATRADLVIEPVGYFPVVGRFFAARHNRTSSSLAAPPFGLSGWIWGGEKVFIDVFDLPEQSLGVSFELTVIDNAHWALGNSRKNQAVTKGKVGQLVEFSTPHGVGKIKVSAFQAGNGTKFILQRKTLVNRYSDIMRDLNVAEIGKQSSVVRVKYESVDPVFAVAIVNELAKAYLTQNVNRRSEEAQKSLMFLDQQLPEIKKSMEVSEEALNAFRTRTNTVNVERENDSLLQKTVAIESNRITLELKRKELLQRYKDDHPIVLAISEQLRTMDSEGSKLSREVSKLPEQQRDFLRLARDVQVGSQLYTSLLNSSQELKIARAGTIGNVRIIDYAVPPESPIKPKRATIAVGAALAGLILGFISCFVARALRPTLRSTEELERSTGLISYAAIPESSVQSRLLIRGKKKQRSVGKHSLLSVLNPDDPAVESLRSLRTGLAFTLVDAPNKNILVTGATAGLGKSFVAANLAVVMAAAGKRILIVDSDLRRPRLDTYFGVPKVPGLADLLSGAVAASQAIKAGAVEGVFVLTAGTSVPNPAELLLSPRFSHLLRELSTVYDHIIFDSAPVLPVGDTLAIAPHCAVTLIVARAELSTAREINDAVRRLNDNGASVKGIIFNGIKRNRIGAGYSYKYHYSYSKK